MSAAAKSPRPQAAAPPLPFVLVCTCGHRTEGTRRAESQRIPCPKCGVVLFIFPSSPLAARRSRASTGSNLVTAGRHNLWKRPLFAAGVTIVLLTAVFLWLLKPAWLFGPVPQPGAQAVPRHRLFEVAEQALSEGAYGEASDRLD